MAPTACAIRATPSASASVRAAAAVCRRRPWSGTRVAHPRGKRATRARLVARAVAADAGGASSALNLLVGSGVLLGLGSAALRARPALSADFQAQRPVDSPDSDEDDSGLRWGVAGAVSCLPLFGFAAWFLPAMGGEVAGSSRDPDDDARARRAQRYLRWAALYGVAYAARGFDPQDPGTWAVAAACAAHVQLERVAFEAETRTAVEKRLARPSETLNPKPRREPKQTQTKRALDVPKARSVLDAFVESAVVKEREAAAEAAGRKSEPDDTSEASAGGKAGDSWRGGDDPLRPSGLGFRLPKGKTLSLSRPRLPEMPEPPELTVRGVGRAIGATQIAAARLREEIEEGKLRAAIDLEEARERERLARERLAIGAEISDWDRRFEVRTMTRDQLMRIARERGMRGYSKLRRGKLLAAVETELYGEKRASSDGSRAGSADDER